MMGMGILGFGGLAVIAAAFGLTVWFSRAPLDAHDRTRGTPEEILRRRLANGEIEGAEYRRRLAELRR